MQLCKLCGQDKQETEFYENSKRTCKECYKARVRARRRENPSVQAYDRERSKLSHRRSQNRATVIRWRRENPAAYKAETAVGNAVRDGKLMKQPCEVCGTEKVHAHHDDYAKPLDVRWLCALHHHRMHAETAE